MKKSDWRGFGKAWSDAPAIGRSFGFALSSTFLVVAVFVFFVYYAASLFRFDATSYELLERVEYYKTNGGYQFENRLARDDFSYEKAKYNSFATSALTETQKQEILYSGGGTVVSEGFGIDFAVGKDVESHVYLDGTELETRVSNFTSDLFRTRVTETGAVFADSLKAAVKSKFDKEFYAAGGEFTTGAAEIAVTEQFLAQFGVEADEAVGKRLSIRFDFSGEKSYPASVRLRAELTAPCSVWIVRDFIVRGVVSFKYKELGRAESSDANLFIAGAGYSAEYLPKLVLENVVEFGKGREVMFLEYADADYAALSERAAENGKFFPFLARGSYFTSVNTSDLIPKKLVFVQYSDFFRAKAALDRQKQMIETDNEGAIYDPRYISSFDFSMKKEIDATILGLLAACFFLSFLSVVLPAVKEETRRDALRERQKSWVAAAVGCLLGLIGGTLGSVAVGMGDFGVPIEFAFIAAALPFGFLWCALLAFLTTLFFRKPPDPEPAEFEPLE